MRRTQTGNQSFFTTINLTVTFRNLLLVLKKQGAVNFIVWCDVECNVRVLDAAQRVGLLADRHSYLLTALDLHTAPLADYSYGGANITGYCRDACSLLVLTLIGRKRYRDPFDTYRSTCLRCGIE